MPDRHRRFLVIRAWAVHFYTSLGIVCAFFALAQISTGDLQALKKALIWLAIALFIDATDGTFARRWQVTVYASQFDGRKLDDIVDYLNYAFIPIFFAYKYGMVSGPWTFVLLISALAAIYGFCQKVAKTNDGYYTGFPNYWDFVIFYLYLFRLPMLVNAAVLLFCAAMVFVPIKYASFSTKPLRKLTVSMAALYGLVMLIIIAGFYRDAVPQGLVWVSLVFPLYYIVLAVYLNSKARKAEFA